MVGFATNTVDLVYVNRATFTMLTGSKITGNNATSSGNACPAVYVSGSGTNFNLKGGTITGNNGTATNSHVPGGLHVIDLSNISLESGSITGNTGLAGDTIIMQDVTSFTVSGAANVGTLTLNAGDAATRTPFAIEQGWTGSINTLNLRGNYFIMETNISYWVTANPIVTGTGVNATTIGKITLGNFLSSTAGETQAISTAHRISTDASTLGRLVKNP